MRRLGQVIRALAVLAGMVLVLGGTPWALVTWVGNPIPPEGLALNAALTDDALIGLLAVIVWVVWAQLVVCTLAAIIEEIRGVDLRSIPGVLASERDLARRAVAAIAVAIVSSTTAAGAATAAASKAPHVTTVKAAQQSQKGSKTTASADRDKSTPGKHALRTLRIVTVTKELSDLWTIAETYLGDGQRWTEIKELNHGRTMVDGRVFRSADVLMPGWRLLMPPDAKGLPLISEVEAADEASRAADVTYIVQPGDTLSSIAERFLGDPNRYPEIFEHNVGRPQPDGGSLTDPDAIWPGWRLAIPGASGHRTDGPAVGRHADRPESGRESAQHRTDERTPARVGPERSAEESQPGPSGSGSQAREQSPQTRQDGADRAEGQHRAEGQQPADGQHRMDGQDRADAEQRTDAQRRPEGEHQPDGRDRPTGEHRADEPTGREQPADQRPRSETGDDAAAPSDADAAPADTAADTADDDSGVPVAAVAGLGAVVAAGLVGLFRLRRTWQRSTRKPGQRIPEPDAEAAALEETLAAGADTGGVDLVDKALRGLLAWCSGGGNNGVLPVIQVARLTEVGVELYLAEPAELPAPWKSLHQQTAWLLERDGEGFAVFNDGGPAPYPALVCLGNDPEMGQLLVDLEFLRTLSLEGPREQTDRMLAALTAGLATSRWADHVDVTIVGTHPDLEKVLKTGRVKYLPEVGDLLNDLAVRAREDAATWSELEVRDVTEARVGRRPEAAGLCVPEIVLLAVEITAEERSRLSQLLDELPRVAVAAVTTGQGSGQWRLRHDPRDDEEGEWVLEPVGLRLRPSRLDDETYRKILELVRTADRPPEGEPAPLTEPAELTEPVAASPLPQRDPEAKEHAWPSVRTTWRADQASEEPTPSSRRITGPPVIDNLGPPRVTNPAVEIPENRLPRVLAFLCYIAENRGCSHEQLDEAMFPGARVNPETRTRYINYARTLLGKDANGRDYLPRRNYTDLSPEIVTTWDLFRDLVGDDPFSAPTDKLERALSLVRGRPYEGVKSAWFSWSEHSARKMYDLIADTACALADRRFSDGQWRAAIDAAVLGWTIEPVQQWLWRVHIQGLRALGDIEEARRIARERYQFAEELELELEPETEQLFSELGLFGRSSGSVSEVSAQRP